jgi:hypothetical protein
MLAKTPTFTALYNHLQGSVTEEGVPCVTKTYRALTARPPPTGDPLCFASRLYLGASGVIYKELAGAAICGTVELR